MVLPGVTSLAAAAAMRPLAAVFATARSIVDALGAQLLAGDQDDAAVHAPDDAARRHVVEIAADRRDAHAERLGEAAHARDLGAGEVAQDVALALDRQHQ